MLSRLLKASLLLREPCELGMSLSWVSRLKCSRLSGGGGDRAGIPIGICGAGDCEAMTGISPEVGVGVVLVECVSPLDPELGPVYGVELWFKGLLKDASLGGDWYGGR